MLKKAKTETTTIKNKQVTKGVTNVMPNKTMRITFTKKTKQKKSKK